MLQSPSWETNWFAVSEEISFILRNRNVRFRTNNLPPPVSILGQPNPVHIPTSRLQEVNPNIMHTSTPRSPQWCLSHSFPYQDPMSPPPHPYAQNAQPISFFSFYHPHNIGWGVTDHLAPRYSIFSVPPLPRPPEVQIFSSTPYSQTPSATFHPSMSAKKFHTHTKQQAKLKFYISKSLNFWITTWKAKDSAPNDNKHFLTSICSLFLPKQNLMC